MGNQHHAHAQLFLNVGNKLQNLRLNSNIQRSGRLIGDQQSWLTGQRNRDHDALAHSTGKLVRVVIKAGLGGGNADQPHHLDGFGARLFLFGAV